MGTLYLRKYLSIVVVSGLYFASTGLASAEAPDDDQFKWNFKVLELVENGNKENGKKIAKEEKCSKCHGDTGISDEDDTPSIAGQTPTYIFKQLFDYKHKFRSERSMHKATKKLSEQQMADMAAFYAAQQPEPRESPDASPPTLVTKGDKSRLLLPCNVCHGKDGQGYGYETPALAGQRKTHFLDTLTEFREDDRENDHYGRMRFIAKQLTEEEIEELATYYGAKPPPEE